MSLDETWQQVLAVLLAIGFVAWLFYLAVRKSERDVDALGERAERERELAKESLALDEAGDVVEAPPAERGAFLDAHGWAGWLFARFTGVRPGHRAFSVRRVWVKTLVVVLAIVLAYVAGEVFDYIAYTRIAPPKLGVCYGTTCYANLLDTHDYKLLMGNFFGVCMVGVLLLCVSPVFLLNTTWWLKAWVPLTVFSFLVAMALPLASSYLPNRGDRQVAAYSPLQIGNAGMEDQYLWIPLFCMFVLVLLVLPLLRAWRLRGRPFGSAGRTEADGAAKGPGWLAEAGTLVVFLIPSSVLYVVNDPPNPLLAIAICVVYAVAALHVVWETLDLCDWAQWRRIDSAYEWLVVFWLVLLTAVAIVAIGEAITTGRKGRNK